MEKCPYGQLATFPPYYALADQFPERYTNLNKPIRGDNYRTIYNRDEDIAWLQEKVAWLFQEAGVDMLPFDYEPAPLLSMGPYRGWSSSPGVGKITW